MLSQRVQNIEDSITLTITAIAATMKKEGKDVIGFGAGEPDFDTPEHIKSAGITAIQSGKNKYTPTAGVIELRQAIADYLLRDQGLAYAPSDILVSCGAKHSIYNMVLALVEPGDEVIIPAPYWVSYPDQVTLAGGTSVFIETNEAQGFKITPAQLEAVITPRTKLLILNSPSNPTGMIYTRAELEALGAVISKTDMVVISDEIYEKLIYGADEHVSLATLSPQLFNQTIVVNGVSKSHAMTGWRIGYAAGRKDIIQAAGKIQSHSTSNPAAASQWAAVEALNGSQAELEMMNKEFVKRRDFMVKTLMEIKGVTCLTPPGAFYTFPNISAYFGKTTPAGTTIHNSVDFCNSLLTEALVACVPGSGFGTEGHIRLSYATSMAVIEKGLERLKTWVNSLT